MENNTPSDSGSSNHWAALKNKNESSNASNSVSKYITPSGWADKESHNLTFTSWEPHVVDFHGKKRDAAHIKVSHIDGVECEPQKLFTPFGRQLLALLPILAEYDKVQQVTVKFTALKGSSPLDNNFTATTAEPVND